MNSFTLLIFIIFFASTAHAHTIDEQQSQVAKLDFLIGHWGGTGTSYSSDGSISTYYDTEHVRFDLDKKLLLINARGEKDGKPTYQLHTVIYYDKTVGHFWYTPYTGERAGRFSCELINKKFTCLNKEQNFRLTFQRLANDKWNEFGERLKDDQWVKTFETILSPLDPN